ncbi:MULTISPECIES: hypothetical protein [unclassified Oceanispirochaeta]|uniref:hypothetical protein n=1 Tax=unclassified Oceanispirochaeta TaxID=2635722 RepID=UPI000E0962B1|nr:MULTISPECIES: hypothetical protein [unclassified Oceanispirochaeta]MBF9018474.1 hypothetical protein [Oceanispirochaeta sp. M2]NPD74880.1 hypothetical protein [Oceanispirochaeta sp. M1]RDG29267.1 hypothetical protein DV872_22545 [Oceanispirochaeta sp. M1]
MGETQVTKDQLFIIDYVKDHLLNWMEEQRILPFPAKETGINPQLLERMVRVEEGIKHQNTNLEKMMIQMDQKFEIMDNRFSENREDMNQRFEAIDKRFNRQGQFLIVIFAAIVTTAISVILQTS